MGFEGDSTVPDEDSLNVKEYKDSAVALVILWFHEGKEVKRQLSSQPKSDMVDHLMAALTDKQYIAGTERDIIGWGTVQGSMPHRLIGPLTDPN